MRLVNFGIPNLSTFGLLGRSPAQPGAAGGYIGFSPDRAAHRRGAARVQTFLPGEPAQGVRRREPQHRGTGVHDVLERTLVCLIMFPIGT